MTLEELDPELFLWELYNANGIYEFWVKPTNTRTRKTIWKERRRRANLPRSIKRRGGAK
jgi:hypothetical protein